MAHHVIALISHHRKNNANKDNFYMKILFVSVSFFLFVLFSNSTVFAENSAYFKISGMLPDIKSSQSRYNGYRVNSQTNNELGLSFSFGKEFENVFIEAEYVFREIDWVDLDIPEASSDRLSIFSSSHSTLLNFGYNFDVTYISARPYIFLGSGINWVRQMRGPNIIYQAGAGINKRLNNNWGVSAGYRYAKSPDLSSKDIDDLKVSYDIHNFEIGIKRYF